MAPRVLTSTHSLTAVTLLEYSQRILLSGTSSTNFMQRHHDVSCAHHLLEAAQRNDPQLPAPLSEAKQLRIVKLAVASRHLAAPVFLVQLPENFSRRSVDAVTRRLGFAGSVEHLLSLLELLNSIKYGNRTNMCNRDTTTLLLD